MHSFAGSEGGQVVGASGRALPLGRASRRLPQERPVCEADLSRAPSAGRSPEKRV